MSERFQISRRKRESESPSKIIVSYLNCKAFPKARRAANVSHEEDLCLVMVLGMSMREGSIH